MWAITIPTSNTRTPVLFLESICYLYLLVWKPHLSPLILQLVSPLSLTSSIELKEIFDFFYTSETLLIHFYRRILLVSSLYFLVGIAVERTLVLLELVLNGNMDSTLFSPQSTVSKESLETSLPGYHPFCILVLLYDR